MDYKPCGAGRVWRRGAIVTCLCVLFSFGSAAESDGSSNLHARAEPILIDPQRQSLRVVKFNDNLIGAAHRDAALESKMLRDFANSVGLEIEWVEVFRSAEAFHKLIDGDGDLSISAIPIEHRDDARRPRQDAQRC